MYENLTIIASRQCRILLHGQQAATQRDPETK